MNWLEYVIETDETVADLCHRLRKLQFDYDDLREKVSKRLTEEEFRDII
jgi:hypothetical protein